jgi:hypothetical protein
MAIISATSGSCTPSDIGFTLGTSSASAVYRSFGGRVFPQPSEYKATGQTYEGYTCKASYLLYDTVTPSPEIRTIINNGEATYQEIFTHGNFSWQDSSDTTEQVSSATITQYEDNQQTPSPKMQAGTVEGWSNGSSTNELVMLHRNYDNGTAQDSGDVEPCGRHPLTAVANDWSPMDANEPCSAWIMKQQACTNVNRIMEVTRDSGTVPMI